jgi:hypothetical protein
MEIIIKSLLRNENYINSLTFYTPPEENGQMIQYSFAQGDEEILVKVSDYSENSSYYKVVEISGDFEPWNSCPVFKYLHEYPLILVVSTT